MKPRNYYVFARQNPEEPFQPVSYNKGAKSLANLGPFSITDLSDFALTEIHASRAEKHLKKNGYEVALVKWVPGKNGIDLDYIVSEEKDLKKFRGILRTHKVPFIGVPGLSKNL